MKKGISRTVFLPQPSRLAMTMAVAIATIAASLRAPTLPVASAFSPSRPLQRFRVRSQCTALQSSSSSSRHNRAQQQQQQQQEQTQEEEEYTVQVIYEGQSCNIKARPSESILGAMERTGAADRLALPSLPSECRRGNCLTCSGRHAPNSQQSSLRRGEDGLSPYMSRQVAESGFVLTCSSHVVGDGVRLVLGECDDAWKAMHQERLESESIRYAGRKAIARMIRLNDEKDVPRWTQKTKVALDKSESVRYPGDDID